MSASRQAPAFRLDVQPDRAAGAAVALIAALAAAGLLGWAASHVGIGPDSETGVQIGVALAGLIGTAASAMLGWRSTRHPLHTLRWDGQVWWLSTGGAELVAQPRPVMDLGGWMLLQLHAAAPVGPWHARLRAALLPRYLAVSRRSCGSPWSMLRATLYASHPTPPSDTASPAPRDSADRP